MLLRFIHPSTYMTTNLWFQLLIIILCTFVPLLNSAQSAYCVWQPANCQMVEEFVLEHHDEIAQQAQLAGVEAPFFLAVVAPEVANFNQLRHEVEYRMLEVFYVEGGTDYANYSVGHFQMKPIFVEQLEQEIKDRDALADLRSSFQYHSQDQREIRSMRVRRLNSVYWQLRYLMVYHRVVQLRFKQLDWEDQADQLAFYAAAYNRGYTHSVSTIKAWMQVAWFPNYGQEPSFIYSEVALDFFGKIKAYW